MYLKSLTLKGFKSFADRTVMRFEPNLAAVVGPNGSGKSNISDAVLWVLGERNAKNLRGQYMEDVIFAGSSARKPVSVAEVELCLDNSDGTLPVDFTEVSIGRRMYRNGESEYLINGSVVRRMDVLDVLHDSGLGTGTNSIISQGNLDSVLSSRPEDRRALIEEAAGVLKHKERKAKSERKLARMDANLTRVRDIAKEVERQLGPLKRKADRAAVHAQLTEELSNLRLALAVDDLNALRVQWDQAKARDERLSAESADLEERLAAVQKELDARQEELALRSSVEGKAAEALSRANACVERFRSASLLLEEKKRRAQQDLATHARTLEESRLAQTQLEQQERESAQALAQATAEHEKAAQALAQLEGELARNKTSRSELRKQVEASTARQRSATHRVEALQARKEALGESIAEQRAQSRLLEKQLEEVTSRKQKASDELGQAQASDAACREAAARLGAAESQAREQLGQAMRARDELRQAVDEARDAFARLSAERAALEELERAEERSNDMLSWLLSGESEHASLPDMTPLTHVMGVPAEWELAAEACLADRLRALVLHDQSQAKQVVAALADAGVAGQASFAVEELAARQAQRSPIEEDAVCLADLAQVEESFRPVVQALLGQVFCADAADQALERAAHASPGALFATRDGVVASSDGVVRVVHLTEEERSRSALARRRALEAVRADEREAQRRFEGLESDLAQAEDVLRAAQSRSLTASEEAAQARGSAESAARELARAQEESETVGQLHDELVQTQAANAAASSDTQGQAEQIEAELAEQRALMERERTGLDELQTSLDPIQRLIVDLSNRISDARLETARLDERVAYGQRMTASRAREREAALRATAEAEERIVRARTVSRRIDPLISAVGQLAERATLTALALEQRSGAEQAFSHELSDAVAQSSRRLRELRERLDGVKSNHAEARVVKGRLEVQVEAAVTAITQDCGVSLETAAKTPALEDRAAAEEEAGKLERRLKAIGSVSPDALRDYESVRERHEFLSTQLEDMDKARRLLSDIVSIIDERMRMDFLTTFDQVNEYFQEIFSTLFPGGSASLLLEDPEEPETTGVEVNAHPVGKRVKKMSLLSGGEKSMTALALLFAVYRTRSTPFYILDEVEAALDDTNLRRLLAYLDTVRDTTQFIMITHQRRTMEQADILYGVSMQSDGVTRVISQKLEQAISHAAHNGSAASNTTT